MRLIFIIRAALWTLLLITIVLLLYLAIVPGGQITYSKNFSRDNFFIQKFTPAERVEPALNGSQKIIGDPVYFNLKTPRRFEKAQLEIKFKNNSLRPIIQAGVLVDKTVWRYNVQPLNNNIIDQIAMVWSNTKEGNVLLLQKEAKYNSISDFLKKLPDRNEVAVFNYDLKNQFKLPSYMAVNKVRSLSVPLRGDYQFYTYIKNEGMDLKFEIYDLNQNRDPDPVDINLYYNNELIGSEHLNDDGIAVDSAVKSAVRNVEIKQANLPEGAYKIEVHCNDDIVTNKITTSLSKLVFINKLWLFGQGVKNINLFTDSDEIGFMTVNPASLQNIKNGSTTFSLGETYKLVTAKRDKKNPKIVLERSDVTVSGNKLFAFDQNELFDPEYNKVDEYFDIPKKNIKYIIAGYDVPQIAAGGWKIATVDIDLSNAYRETLGFFQSGPSQYSFMISIPGLVIQHAQQENIEVSEISVKLEGSSLWRKVTK